MRRTIIAVVVGILAFGVLLTATDRTLRFLWPAYAAVWQANTFDLSMMLARLSESTVDLAIAAWIAARMAPGSRALPWALGLVLLAIFAPIHYGLWSKFPIWYHAYFLTSLVLVSGIAGTLARPKGAAPG